MAENTHLERESPEIQLLSQKYHMIHMYAKQLMCSTRHGLTGGEQLILQTMYTLTNGDLSAEVSFSDLVEQLPQGKSALSKMTSGMEKKGILSRRVNPDNRRSILVQLTESYRPIYQEIQSRNEEFLLEAVSHIGLKRIEQAVDTIEAFMSYSTQQLLEAEQTPPVTADTAQN